MVSCRDVGLDSLLSSEVARGGSLSPELVYLLWPHRCGLLCENAFLAAFGCVLAYHCSALAVSDNY
eukprot:2319342-Amphidinium_carterae.2